MHCKKDRERNFLAMGIIRSGLVGLMSVRLFKASASKNKEKLYEFSLNVT